MTPAGVVATVDAVTLEPRAAFQTGMCQGRDMSATPAVKSRDKVVSANGLRFHYREWGSEDASPLLILHGLSGHAWEFDNVAAALADRFHVFVVNQRGHGASEWAQTYSPDIMADDIRAIIEELGTGRVSVIGHSMGAINAYHVAARHPELIERLVLLDAGPDDERWRVVTDAFIPTLQRWSATSYADPEEAITEYVGDASGPSAEELGRFVRNNLRQREDGRWEWRFDTAGISRYFHALASETSQLEMLQRVQCPTLVVRAGDSWVLLPTAAQRMVQHLPSGRLVEIPGAGHDIHIDRMEALVEELRGFLIDGM